MTHHTLLLDLDDTLLGNELSSFLPAYLGSLGKHLTQYADPATLVARLMEATGGMTHNQRPDQTLEEVFAAAFYPSLGTTKEAMTPDLEAFYRDVFPTLKRVTKIRPEAVRLVAEAKERGWRMVVATNPLFPYTAISQRVSWAGFDLQDSPFEVIPSFETFHFAKPQPAYYAEMLAHLGWPEGPVIMVGDDPITDVSGARQLGLSVFWVNPDQKPFPSEVPVPTGSGSLEDLLPWIDSQPAESLVPDFSTPGSYLAILRSTPAILDTLSKNISGEEWSQSPAPGEWCLAEIVCHLRDVDAEVNLPRLQQIIQEDNPFLPGKDTDRWANERQYIAQNCLQALDDYMAYRLKLLNLLENLPLESWNRPARHAIFGPTTLKELVGIAAAHDRLHARQVVAVIQVVSQLKNIM